MKLYELRGNTMHDMPLKVPKETFCPVCGQYVVFTNKNGTRWLDANRAAPEAEYTMDAYGKLLSAELYWRCSRCGVRWMDGQFAQDDKGGAA